MSFNVAAEAYDRFMGRFSTLLAPQFADYAGVTPGAGLRALDVGCGPGALTAELVARLGPHQVVAIDPSEPFVAAARERHPEVDIRQAPAERLPLETGSVDAALAQLVVHFMADPQQGVREMARVAVPGGTIAVCVWDHAGGRGPLSTFWRAVADVTPDAPDESFQTGSRGGDLSRLLTSAGLVDVEESDLTVTRTMSSFDEWWQPYQLGVGPAGDHVASLDEPRRNELVQRCRELLGEAPFDVGATTWVARGRVPQA